jgi:hypothetical protein
VRILLVSQMYPGPGAPDLGVFVEQLEEALRDRGHEEVGVDDVGPERASGSEHVEGEATVTPPRTGTLDDRAGELVTALAQLALEVGDEDAEVRVAQARVHLRDEQDPQRRYPRVTCRIPRHISSVVPSPQST